MGEEAFSIDNKHTGKDIGGVNLPKSFLVTFIQGMYVMYNLG